MKFIDYNEIYSFTEFWIGTKYDVTVVNTEQTMCSTIY